MPLVFFGWPDLCDGQLVTGRDMRHAGVVAVWRDADAVQTCVAPSGR
jgi:hypothetical protein